MNYLFIGLLFATALSGCATSYHKAGFTGGFSETRLAENIFQISYRGNAFTSAERASDFSLLRAAELTLDNGYHYFAIIDSREDSSLSTYTTPTRSQTSASAYGYGNYAYGQAQTTTYGGQTHYISKPSANNKIICFREKPDIAAVIFDAEFLLHSIREKYGLQP